MKNKYSYNKEKQALIKLAFFSCIRDRISAYDCLP